MACNHEYQFFLPFSFLLWKKLGAHASNIKLLIFTMEQTVSNNYKFICIRKTARNWTILKSNCLSLSMSWVLCSNQSVTQCCDFHRISTNDYNYYNLHLIRTFGWFVESCSGFNVFKDIVVIYFRIWMCSSGENFPQSHTIGPLQIEKKVLI